jgi:hypothetical protein
MKLLLERDVKAPTFTLGRLHVNQIRQFYTCEDAVRQVAGVPVEEWKIKGETAIPTGVYRIVVNHSNRFKKKLPQLLDVKGFEGIRIHSGNTKADTEGCILVGTHRTKEGVANSRFACEVLQNEIERAIARGEVVTIQIS